MYQVTAEWASHVAKSHAIANRVDVWDVDDNKKVGTLPYKAGVVQDQWVSGARRTLSLTVIPTDQVKQLLYPGVELRPFSGINYGAGLPEMVPLGRFPLVEDIIGTKPADVITLSLQDEWQWIVDSPFIIPRSSDTGTTIVAQIIKLIVETGQWTAGQITNLCTSQVPVAALVWDTDRHQAILDLATSIGAEVFISRDGSPTLRPRQTPGTPVATFAPQLPTTPIDQPPRQRDLTVSRSTADVYNVVRAVSTNTDPAFQVPAYIARITDPTHPAYPGKGRPIRSYQLTSPLFIDPVQMQNSAEKVLSKVSQEARVLTLDPTGPDPSLDASDTIAVTWPIDGSAPFSLAGTTEQPQIGTINHPLTLSDTWQIVTASSRSDEDYTP